MHNSMLRVKSALGVYAYLARSGHIVCGKYKDALECFNAICMSAVE